MRFTGFFDIQVNGANGVDVNNPETIPEQWLSMLSWLWSKGVVKIYPTVITNSRPATLAILANIARVREADFRIKRSVPGIHLEGPYISPKSGARGAHTRRNVRLSDWDEFRRFQEAASGLIKIVTLAPEREYGYSFIEMLAKNGIVAAIGHSAGNADSIQKAVDFGARFSTHLGNGIASMVPRHDNAILAQLASRELSAGLIADLHHLPPLTLKAYVQLKTPGHCVLTSDSMFAAGLPAGSYVWAGKKVRLCRAGRMSLCGTHYLAGSVLNLATAVENTASVAGVSRFVAIRMASDNPAKLMGEDLSDCSVDVGWDDDGLTILKTTVGGEVVWQA